MGSYTVYQVDYGKKIKIPIGAVTERRKTERGNNFFDLLRFARTKYAKTPEEGLRITLGRTKINSKEYYLIS
ncbi:MAG: hypothetical protein HW377_244 [Actinobacteria bacterium]|nr:hypothetical protein [Actinomycetota bacterium]MBM2827815.1 hypothetical protein [Actinomycetota bacterium]